MADKGSVLVRDKDVDLHRHYEKLLFDRKDGDWQIKLLLSSYSFTQEGAQGYPDGQSDCEKYLKNPYSDPNETCKSVQYQPAHDPQSCGYDSVKDGQWQYGQYTRVHRDRQIILSMRRWTGLDDKVDNDEIGLPSNCQ